MSIPAETRTPLPPGEESAGPAYVELVAGYHWAIRELHRLVEYASRRWSFYREVNQGTTDNTNGNLVLDLQALAQGWEAEIEHLTIQVDGASHAATVVVYRNGNNGPLLDFASALVGDSPSRLIRTYERPLRLGGGEFITIVITGATHAANLVVARAEGRKRET